MPLPPERPGSVSRRRNSRLGGRRRFAALALGLTPPRAVLVVVIEGRGGDVAPGATATSGPQTITVDVSGTPTQSLALPVTYKFSVDGAAVETTGLLTFRRAE